MANNRYELLPPTQYANPIRCVVGIRTLAGTTSIIGFLQGKNPGKIGSAIGCRRSHSSDRT